MSKRIHLLLAVFFWVASLSVDAMGIRSFVALPLDEGGTVLRAFGERLTDNDINILTGNLAYGLTGRQTLFAAIPYRISGGTGDRLGDFGFLYRPTVWQKDEPGRTFRIGLLGGVIVPTDADRDPRLQLGGVITNYRGRHEIDADFLWREGLGNAPNSARYDLSWQYRLSPAVFPEWGISSWWNSVLELSGRWQKGNEVRHFITAGIQRIWPQWVLEGGFSRDISGGTDTAFLISARYHF